MCVDWCVCLPNLPSFVYIKSPFYPKFTRFFIPKIPPFHQNSTPIPNPPKYPLSINPLINPKQSKILTIPIELF